MLREEGGREGVRDCYCLDLAGLTEDILTDVTAFAAGVRGPYSVLVYSPTMQCIKEEGPTPHLTEIVSG